MGDGTGRTYGEGSPRHSGEETDPFLQASHSPQAMQDTAAEMGSRPGVPRVPVPSTSLSSSGSSSTNQSGYGTLLERPTLGILPPTAEESELGPGGYHLTAEEMRQLDNESVLPRDEHSDYTGAYAISRDPVSHVRLLDPENVFGTHDVPRPPPQVQHRTRESVGSNPSIIDAEDAALLTVRRVKVGESPVESPASMARTGFLESIGLAGLSNLTRLSWFGDENSNSGDNYSPTPARRHSRRSPTFQAVPLSDADVETGRAFLRPDSLGRVRDGPLGLGPDGERPSSHMSATSASGGTIWHDAHSSLPGTPQLALPPRAITPAGVAYPERDWLTGRDSPLRMANIPAPLTENPFVIENERPDSPPVASPSGDVLDLPAPTPLTHFASSSSIPDDTGTVSSIGLSKNPYPPGLEYMAKGRTWSYDGSVASSPGWQGVTHRVNLADIGEHQDPDVVDMLEEQPPHAQETWRSMTSSNTSASGYGEMGRRTTFGLVSRFSSLTLRIIIY